MGGCRQEAAGEEEEQQQEQELPCFLSQSQSLESIELEFHIQLKFGCCQLQQASRQNPPQQRGVDQIGFLDLQPARLLPSLSLRGFLCWALFISSTLHSGASQLGATENNSSLALFVDWASSRAVAQKVHPVASLSNQGVLLNGFPLKDSTCILKLEYLWFCGFFFSFSFP